MAVSEFVSFLFLEILNDESEIEFTHVPWCIEKEINFIYQYSKRESMPNTASMREVTHKFGLSMTTVHGRCL